MGPALSPLFYIFLTTFLVSFAVCMCFLKAWCREQEDKFKKGGGGLPCKMEMDLMWSEKNLCSDNELETSVSSIPGTSTYLLHGNQLGLSDSISNASTTSRFFYPLHCNSNKKRLHKSDSELEIDRLDRYDKPVDIIIHVEDFDEIYQSDVNLKGNLNLPVCDEPDDDDECFEMKPITTWKDWSSNGENKPFKFQELRNEEILI